MWEIEIAGVDLYHILAWLFVYSFLGWLWESCYVSIKQKKLVNRGFVTGPVCTIYGVGAVSVYLILKPLADNLIVLYFGGVLVATVLEYFTAVLMEKLFHTSWWDYSNNRFNFQGRICLGSSIAWGFFTVVMFRVLQPFVEMIVSLVSESTGQVILMVVMFVYAADFGFATATAMELGKKLEQVEKAMADFNDQLQKSKLYTSASEALEALENHRRVLRDLNLKERMEKYQELMSERFEKLGLQEQKEAAVEKWKEVSEKLSNAVNRGSWNSRRLIKAYPNLSKATRVHRKLIHLSRLERKKHKKGKK